MAPPLSSNSRSSIPTNLSPQALQELTLYCRCYPASGIPGGEHFVDAALKTGLKEVDREVREYILARLGELRAWGGIYNAVEKKARAALTVGTELALSNQIRACTTLSEGVEALADRVHSARELPLPPDQEETHSPAPFASPLPRAPSSGKSNEECLIEALNALIKEKTTLNLDALEAKFEALEKNNGDAREIRALNRTISMARRQIDRREREVSRLMRVIQERIASAQGIEALKLLKSPAPTIATSKSFQTPEFTSTPVLGKRGGALSSLGNGGSASKRTRN